MPEAIGDRLRILILEDEPADAELIVRQLETSDIDASWERVDTEREFVERLAEPPDIILSDYSMPQFDALRALEILRERNLEVPVVIVSGTIGEDLAVAAMRAGASDYLLKDRMARLGMAVRHQVKQQRITRAHRSSEEARNRLAAAVDQTGEGLVILDAAGRIEYMNPAYENISGRSREESIGRLYWLLDEEVPLPGGTWRREELRQALAAGEPWKGRLDHPGPDGHVVEMDLAVSPVRDDSGRVYSFVCVFRDLSERVLLERSMRQAQKMEAIGRLAGGMAHDFNNLLTAILGYGELILNRLDPDSPLAPDMEQVISAGKRGARLTRRLLSFSRREPLAVERIDLNALLRDMESLLHRLIGEDVEIRMDLSADTPEILADRGELEQVVLNLAVNARDAMPGGGSLTLASERERLDAREAALRPDVTPGVYAVLIVADTGHGIDPESQARIFEPFFTTKETGAGTGLGLSTVFGIARQSRGHVEVESEVGAGARFRVYLPAAEPEPAPATVATPSPAAETRVASERGTATRILVVEDEEATGVLVSRLLREKGYEVLVARNGVEARVLAEEQTGGIDLLLTDVIMPIVSGPELAEQLRARWSDLRVLFMTGYSGELLEAHDFNSDTEYLVYKPFTLDELDRAVRHALRGERRIDPRAGRFR